MWNRLRYSSWAPWYDALVGAAGFEEARRRSIDHLALASGAHVLIVGAGTGLDLEHLPRGVHVTAVDVTPAMWIDSADVHSLWTCASRRT
jgi:phosphatidylethanolamine/phosphatidyl-N-methylethanolamine N-methyltransferase